MCDLSDAKHPSDITREHNVSKSDVYAIKKKAFQIIDNKLSLQWLLTDKPRSGRPLQILIEARTTILKTACQKPVDLGLPRECLTYRKLIKYLSQTELKVSLGYIAGLMARRKICLTKYKGYLTSTDKDDPSKIFELAERYKAPRDKKLTNTVVISVDEKTGIQALGNSKPYILLNPDSATKD